MNFGENIVCYATGEIAMVGDCVVDDVWLSIVEDVIASADDMARWGLNEPGLMLKTEAVGLVFESLCSTKWESITFKSRKLQ
jgi:hypothetical protein